MQIEIPARRRRSVSLTPLIDVVFNLLLFFMLASSLTDWRGLTLATGSEVASANETAAAEVALRADGELRYGNDVLDVQALSERLARELDNGEISSVILRSEQDVNVGAVVDTFDRLAAAGITALALGDSNLGFAPQ